MPRFQDLPVVLQDLCVDFAWKTTYRNVKENIEELLLIKSFNLPPLFYKTYLFSTEHMYHMYSPLEIYEPLWCYLEMFDIFMINDLLCNLDFRKRSVKCAGSRYFWLDSFDHYINILQFGQFYKSLLASKQNIWTPTYNAQLKHGAATHLR